MLLLIVSFIHSSIHSLKANEKGVYTKEYRDFAGERREREGGGGIEQQDAVKLDWWMPGIEYWDKHAVHAKVLFFSFPFPIIPSRAFVLSRTRISLSLSLHFTTKTLQLTEISTTIPPHHYYYIRFMNELALSFSSPPNSKLILSWMSPIQLFSLASRRLSYTHIHSLTQSGPAPDSMTFFYNQVS